MRIVGYAELSEQLDPRLVAIEAGASVMAGDYDLGTEIAVVRDGDALAVGFRCSTDHPYLRNLVDEQRLAARAVCEDRDGVTVVCGVGLVEGPGEVWREVKITDFLDDRRRLMQARITIGLVKGAGNMTLPIPRAARPPGPDGVLELALVGDIGGEHYNARDCAKAMEFAGNRSVYVVIDSAGGAIADARSFYRALVEHPYQVTTHCTNSALSAAGIVFLAGDIRRIESFARWNTHLPRVDDARTLTAADLRQAADSLDAAAAELVKVIATRSGNDANDVAAWMADDTTLDAGSAVALGIATEVSHEAIPPAPQTRKAAKLRPVAAPFTTYRPKALSAPAPFAYGSRYRAGDVVAHAGRRWAATGTTFGAPGLEPGRALSWRAL